MNTNELVTYRAEDGYAVLLLNRPEKRNAMNRDAQRALWAALDRARSDKMRAIIISGSGDKAFCSGADLKDESQPFELSAGFSNSWAYTQRLLAEHPAAIIAAVNGYALGGGLTLVNNADLAVASRTATFGAPEITFGIYPALAGPSTVRRLLPKHAAQIVLLGERLDAEAAYRMGLVNEVVSPEELLPRAEAIAAAIAKFDGVSVDVSKEALRAEQDMGWNQAMDHGMRSTAFIGQLRKANAG